MNRHFPVTAVHFSHVSHPDQLHDWPSYPLDTSNFSQGWIELSVKLTAHFSSSAVVEDAWSYITILPHIFMEWCLIQHKNRFF